jgi:hypothetical protein
MRRFGIFLENIDFLKRPDFVAQALRALKDGTFDHRQRLH